MQHLRLRQWYRAVLARRQFPFAANWAPGPVAHSAGHRALDLPALWCRAPTGVQEIESAPVGAGPAVLDQAGAQVLAPDGSFATPLIVRSAPFCWRTPHATFPLV